MSTPKKKRRAKLTQVAEDFAIGRSTEPVKPPSKKELDRMRQREVIRKHPTTSI